MKPLLIQPITSITDLIQLQQDLLPAGTALVVPKKVNAIAWRCVDLPRGADGATISCGCVWLNDGESWSGGSIESGVIWEIQIDNETLQAWGEGDDVIDEIVLASSKLFCKL